MKKLFPETILNLLKKNGINYQHINHGVVVTMDDVKKELNIPIDSMAKTLVIKTPAGYISVALSGFKRLSMKKLASVLHFSKNSINFLPKESFESIVGVPTGATPPFCLDMPLIIDKHLANQDMIYCSGGTLIDTIGMKFGDFLMASNGSIEDVIE